MAAIGHANAHLFSGRPDRYLEICSELAGQTGFARRVGLVGLLNGLPASGRGEDARALADKALAAVREEGNPFWIGFALLGYGRAFAETDPRRAMKILREGVVYTAGLGLTFWEAVLAREAASLEAVHGDLHDALDLFDSALQSQYRANNVAHVVAVLACLAVFFNRLHEPLAAATIYGSSTPYGTANRVKGLREACQQLRETLGEDQFERCVADGAAMTFTAAVHHARREIERAHLIEAPRAHEGSGPADHR
jgi:hypothetical protein